MTPIEKRDAILIWLAFSPFARGNVTFQEIEKGIVREHPSLGNNSNLSSELYKILDNLVSLDYVVTWPSSMAYYSEIGKPPDTRIENRYTTTMNGQIYAYDLLPKSKSNLSESDFQILEKALPLLSEYGRINFTSDVSNVLYKEGITVKPDIERFLYNNGFTKIIFPIAGSPNSEKVLTDRGRKLKELGSYKKFIEQISADKIYDSSKEKLQMEVNIKQSELITNQINTNESVQTTNANTVKSNETVRKILLVTVVISIFSLVTTLLNFTYDISKDKTGLDIKHRDIIIQSVQQQLSQIKRENDSLKTVLDSSIHKP